VSCNSLAADITAAVKTTSIASSDVMPLVRESTLYGYTFATLQTALGVTGSIVNIGSDSAVQILNVPATNTNKIRSILPLQGITATVGASESIELKTNFVNSGSATDGKQILVDPTAAQIKVKRLKAGLGLSITETTDSISFATTALTLTSKTVIVSSMADFPDAVDGVRTLLEADYALSTDLSTADRFVSPTGTPCVIRAADRTIVGLTYTGTGAMFTAVNPTLTIKSLGITCANGTLLDTTGSTSGLIKLTDVSATEVKNLGVIDSVSITATSSVVTSLTNEGFTFLGTGIAANIESILFRSISAGVELFELGTATFARLGINNISVNASAATSVFISGAAASANMESGVVANVTGVTIGGDMTSLSGVTASDNQYDFANCNTIPRTRPDAFMVFLSATTTTLSAATPALISGTWTSVRTSHMAVTAAGRATYTGENGGTFPIIATITAQPVSSTNKVINFYFAKNGAVVANSKVKAIISNAIPEQHTILWQDALVKGDYYEVFVESADGTNVQIDNAKFAVN
jgi:hypothetical protein